MNIPQKHQAELAKIRESLQQAMTTANTEEWQRLVTQTLKRIDKLYDGRAPRVLSGLLKRASPVEGVQASRRSPAGQPESFPS